MKPRRPALPPKSDTAYRRLWRIVDGAVADAFAMHPEYLKSTRSERFARMSINKRVVGAILGCLPKGEGR